MAMTDWIDKYPQVKALLQRKGERLTYAPDGEDVSVPERSGELFRGPEHPGECPAESVVEEPAFTWDAALSDEGDDDACPDERSEDAAVYRGTIHDSECPGLMILDDPALPRDSDTDAWPADIVQLPGTITWEEQLEIVRRIAETVRQDAQEGFLGACGHPVNACPHWPCRWCRAVPHPHRDRC
jgi:hypothetical protein